MSKSVFLWLTTACPEKQEKPRTETTVLAFRPLKVWETGRDVILKQKCFYVGLTKEKGYDPHVSRWQSSKQSHFTAQAWGVWAELHWWLVHLAKLISNALRFVQRRWHSQPPPAEYWWELLETVTLPCTAALHKESGYFHIEKVYKGGVASRSRVWDTSISVLFLTSWKHAGTWRVAVVLTAPVLKKDKNVFWYFWFVPQWKICVQITCWIYGCPVSAGSKKRASEPHCDHSSSFSSSNICTSATAMGSGTMSKLLLRLLPMDIEDQWPSNRSANSRNMVPYKLVFYWLGLRCSGLLS